MRNLNSIQEINALVKSSSSSPKSLFIVVIHASWCHTCENYFPVIKQFENEFSEFSFYSADVNSANLVKHFSDVPTTLIISRGEIEYKIVGYNGHSSKVKLKGLLQKYQKAKK